MAEAEELRRAALQVAGNATDARIEWNETEQIDASVLQVLVSLKAEVAAAGRALSVGPAGAAIATYLQTAGLSSDLSVGAAA